MAAETPEVITKATGAVSGTTREVVAQLRDQAALTGNPRDVARYERARDLLVRQEQESAGGG